MKRELLFAEFLTTPWALAAERFAALSMLMERWQAGIAASPQIMAEVLADATAVAARRQAATGAPGAIAVLPMYGVIAQRGNMVDDVSGPGSLSTERFGAALQDAVSDPAVKGIVLDVDSPGGSVYGVQNLAQQIYDARQQKPVYAVANSLAASAAYWLGSQASKFYVTPGGEVGSIGVFAAHRDESKAGETRGEKMTLISAGKYKTEGNPYEPLSDDGRTYMQSRIDAYYGQFAHDVARGRGVPVATVRGDVFGAGRVVGDHAALDAGMVDAVGTREQAIRELAQALKPKPLSRAALLRREYGISG